MQIATMVKPYQLIAPQLLGAATTHGTGKQITPGELKDGVAVVSIGAVAGTPDSFTVVVTIEESATLNGTYDTLATFDTATAANEIATKPIVFNPAKPFVRATVVTAFVNGTSPTVAVGVNLLEQQVAESTSNEGALS